MTVTVGESATMARQIVDIPPWRIGSATGENEPRLALIWIRLPAWLWMSTAVPSVACAIAVAGRQNSGLAASIARRERPGFTWAAWS